MGRPLICNTCCPTDDPPPPTDCLGAIGVAFIDETSSFRQAVSKITKYLEAFPDRLIFVMDVAFGGNGQIDYSKYPNFVSSDRCYSLKLEHQAGVSVPEFIKRDSSGFVSDVYSYITTILNDSSKSSDEVREIWNTATEVSVFRDSSGSMEEWDVENTYQKFRTDVLSNGKIIVSSVYNNAEDFICPFVYEQCCINQAAADLILQCGLPECTPAELRFRQHPSGPYVIDDPCDSASCNNSEGGCSSCPTIIPAEHTVEYTAAVVQSDGSILTHPDIDYYLQYSDDQGASWTNTGYTLPSDKSNVMQSLDVLLKNWAVPNAGTDGLTGFQHIQDLGPTVPSVFLGEDGSKRFGWDNAMSANGDTIVIVEHRPVTHIINAPNIPLRSAKICTYKRNIHTPITPQQAGECDFAINYELVNDFLTSEAIEGLSYAAASVDLSDDGLTLIVGTPNNGALLDAFDGSSKKATGEWKVYDWVEDPATSSGSWVQRGLTGTISTDSSEGQEIGTLVAISSDGDTAIVSTAWNSSERGNSIDPLFPGDSNRGAVYVYIWDGTSWVSRGSGIRDFVDERALPHSGYPRDFSVDANADYIVISTFSYDVPQNPEGRDHHGAVRVFVYNDALGEWNQIGNTITTSTVLAYVGQAVCISKVTSLTPTKEARIAVLDTTSVYVYDYDENTDTWVQKGNTISRDNEGDNVSSKTKSPSMAFTEDKNTLIIGDYTPVTNDNQQGKVKVLKLTGDTWAVTNTFISLHDAIDHFGTDVLISRRGFSVPNPCGGTKSFGHTLLFSIPLLGEYIALSRSSGQAQIYLTDPAAPDCFLCHPLISQYGDTPSSCDLYDDTDIGNNCTRRVFKREFRIMASDPLNILVSVFSDVFKLYQYFGMGGAGGDIEPPNITGDWVREFTTTTSISPQPYRFSDSHEPNVIQHPHDDRLITSRFKVRRTNDTSGLDAYKGNMTHFKLCPAIVYPAFDSDHPLDHLHYGFQRLVVSNPYSPSLDKGTIQHYVLGEGLSLSERLASERLANRDSFGNWHFEDRPFWRIEADPAHEGLSNYDYLGYSISPTRSKDPKPGCGGADGQSFSDLTDVPTGFWYMNGTKIVFEETYGFRGVDNHPPTHPVCTPDTYYGHHVNSWAHIGCTTRTVYEHDLVTLNNEYGILPDWSEDTAHIVSDGDGDTVAVRAPDGENNTRVSVLRTYGGVGHDGGHSIHEIFNWEQGGPGWNDPRHVCLNDEGNVIAFSTESDIHVYELFGPTHFTEQPSEFKVHQQSNRRSTGVVALLAQSEGTVQVRMDKSGNNILLSNSKGQIGVQGEGLHVGGWAVVLTYDPSIRLYKMKGRPITGPIVTQLEDSGEFGINSDISSDGNSIVVSSREPNIDGITRDPESNHHGAIRCYTWNGAEYNWEQLGEVIRGQNYWSNLGFHLSYEADHVKRIAAFEGTDQSNQFLGDISMYRFEERR